MINIARYVGDQNQITFLYESGTYNTSSGAQQWIGAVQNHTLNDDTGVISIRYVGTGNRNVDQFVDGPRDVKGTITFFPQDWKFLAFALGSNVDAGSPSPYTHTISEVNSASGNAFTSGTLNPFISFGVVDSQKGAATGENFIRTVAGAIVDSFTFSASQGEILSAEVNYTAQDTTFSSGALGAVTAATTRPYIWSDFAVHKPSGTKLDAVKGFTFTVNNNLQANHYLNGSRQVSVPLPLNRDYEFELTVDATSEKTKEFYDQNFIGGSQFNLMLEVNASTGSRDMFLVLSGCKVIDMEAPSPADGVNEQTLTIRPTSASAVVNDAIQFYNPW